MRLTAPGNFCGNAPAACNGRGRAAWQAGLGKCEQAVVAQLRDLLDKRLATPAGDLGLLDATA